jgi:hypothetical protein
MQEAHLIPNPILKVLSTLSCHMVRHLLIGGQACVLYGAAEFSRDCDVVILADDENLRNLLLAQRVANAFDASGTAASFFYENFFSSISPSLVEILRHYRRKAH